MYINAFLRVLLLEAGDDDKPNVRISVPLVAAYNAQTKADWTYYTVPQNRSSQQLVGKVVFNDVEVIFRKRSSLLSRDVSQ